MKVHTIHLCPKKTVSALILPLLCVRRFSVCSSFRRDSTCQGGGGAWVGRWMDSGIKQRAGKLKTQNVELDMTSSMSTFKAFFRVRQRMMCVVWTSTAHTCATKRCLVFMEHWVQFENSPFARSHFRSSFGTLLCAVCLSEKGTRAAHTWNFFCEKKGILHRHCTTMREVSFFDGFYARLRPTTMTLSFW